VDCPPRLAGPANLCQGPPRPRCERAHGQVACNGERVCYTSEVVGVFGFLTAWSSSGLQEVAAEDAQGISYDAISISASDPDGGDLNINQHALQVSGLVSPCSLAGTDVILRDLQRYILLCCQELDGGLRDKPGK
jgi:hypothetical protein